MKKLRSLLLVTAALLPNIGHAQTACGGDLFGTIPNCGVGAITHNNLDVGTEYPDWGRFRGTLGTGVGVPYFVMQAMSAIDANVGIAVVPKGTAGFSTHVPDGTAVGGPLLGQYAVDLQMLRTRLIGGAGGNYSAVLYGQNSAAPNTSALAGGDNNSAAALGASALGGSNLNADGSYSAGFGGLYGSAKGRYAQQFFASGRFSITGDAQIGTQVWRGTTSTATGVRLTADGAAAGSANVANLQTAAGSYSLRLTLTAFDATAPINTYTWSLSGMLTKTTTAASSTVWTPLGTPQSVATNSWAPNVSAAADTTNGGLNLTFIPPAGNTDTTRVVARIESVEVQ